MRLNGSKRLLRNDSGLP